MTLRSALACICVVVCVAMMFTQPVDAQTGGGYDLTWHAVDSGIPDLSAGGYSLGSTAGQAEPAQLSGGGYTLNAGYRLPALHRVYLPLVLRGL